MRSGFLLVNFLLLVNFAISQDPVRDAFLISRMCEKFHVQPRPLDDQLSSQIFNKLINELDPDRIIFTREDYLKLSAFKLNIDDEIKQQKSTFLKLLIKLFQDRLIVNDTMVASIISKPFNFSLPDKITITEDTSFALNESSRRSKMQKTLKAEVLETLLDDNKIYDLNAEALNKYILNEEPKARAKVRKILRHENDLILKSAGGVERFVGETYCKVIALCYDPHTEYFPLTEKENFESALGQQSMAFGFNFKEDDNGTVIINEIAPGSPAFKSGQLNKGDQIKSVQWEDQKPIDLAGSSINEISQALSLSNHDKAILNIKKSDGSEKAVTLYKSLLEENDDDNKVKSFILKGPKTIGFISLPSFYEDWENEDQNTMGCANDVAKAIIKLKRENIQGLILDLRFNGGGSVQEAIELAGIFIDAGPVGQYKSRNEKAITLKDVNRGTVYDGPLILLVNGYSASASEMLAGTLQDYNRALIVGSSTYGKATAQAVLPMDTSININKDNSKAKAGSYLKLTLSQLYRVNGTTAQASGVVPDIVLPDLLEVNGQRESANENVLISTPIEGNKYFKPMTALPVSEYRNIAKNDVAASIYFTEIEKFISGWKANTVRKDINLKISDVIQARKKTEELRKKISESRNDKSGFTVAHSAAELQQIQVNKSFKEMTEQWSEFLLDDPYVNISFDLITKMIK